MRRSSPRTHPIERSAGRRASRRGAALGAALGALWLGVHGLAHGDPLPAPGGAVVLSVLSYNVKGLPLVTDLDRLERIGEVLAERRRLGTEPDVVVLQEAFVEQAQHLRRRAGYPYVSDGCGDQQGPFANDSGLEILSNYPILDRYGRSFDDCAFPDCLVSKSICGATIQYPGVPAPLQVFTTHLQAESRNEAVRRNQIDDIAVFLSRIHFGHELAVFAGDFNFKPRHGSYRKFLRELPVTDAGAACLAQPATCEIVVGTDGRTDRRDVWQSSNDRQFFYHPSGSAVRIAPIRIARNFTERFQGEPLSDHWGYEVDYRISW